MPIEQLLRRQSMIYWLSGLFPKYECVRRILKLLRSCFCCHMNNNQPSQDLYQDSTIVLLLSSFPLGCLDCLRISIGRQSGTTTTTILWLRHLSVPMSVVRRRLHQHRPLEARKPLQVQASRLSKMSWHQMKNASFRVRFFWICKKTE